MGGSVTRKNRRTGVDFTYVKGRKIVEIPETILWEHPPKEFKLEDCIPPEKWDYQIKKVKL